MPEDAPEYMEIWNSSVSTHNDGGKMDVTGRAFILNERRDRILLLKRTSTESSSNHWEPPGGGIEPYETIAEGIVRGAGEESGIKIFIPTKLVSMRSVKRGARKSLQKFGMEFVIPGTVRIKLSNEHSDWMLAAMDEIKNGNLLMRLNDQKDCVSVLQSHETAEVKNTGGG